MNVIVIIYNDIMTDKEKIEILEGILVAEGILDDFDTAAADLDDTVNIDKATDIISQSKEFGDFLRWCSKKASKYKSDSSLGYFYARKLNGNYMSKTGKDICLHLAYPLYIDPNTLGALDELLPVMPNQIDLGSNDYHYSKDFYIDDIDNVNPSTTFNRVVAGTTIIRDARTISDMDFFIKSRYEEDNLFIVDSFHQSLKMDHCNIWFNRAGSNIATVYRTSKLLFRCPTIPILSNVVTDANRLGFYDTTLFSNKRNQKFFNLFEWNTSWTAPDGKSIVIKKFEDLEKIFDIGHKEIKKYLDIYDKINSRTRYPIAPSKNKPVLATPIALSKNAKLSDVIDISGFTDLGVVVFSNGELNIEFNRRDKHDVTWASKFEISLGQTLDSWFVYIGRDRTSNKHRGDFGGW